MAGDIRPPYALTNREEPVPRTRARLSSCVSRVCQTSPSTQCRVHPPSGHSAAPVGRI